MVKDNNIPKKKTPVEKPKAIKNRVYDTYTKAYVKLTDATRYKDLSGKKRYTTRPVSLHRHNESILVCSSLLKKYSKYLEEHPLNAYAYIILGLASDSNLATSKFRPLSKIYSVSNSNTTIPNYKHVDNKLKFLEPYTFGVELETSVHTIKQSVATNLGFYELYDGSIYGPEYASGILKYTNLQYIYRFMEYLKSTSNYNTACSLHLHIGGFEYTNNKAIAIYSLFQRLQDDLNLIIAPYKKDPKFLGSLDKYYCKDLPVLPKATYSNLLELFKLKGVRNLEDYIHNTNKWSQNGRYYTVNFLNYLCKNDNEKTIECRSLQMTHNFNYFLTWLIINTSIIHYAINLTDSVLDKKVKITIEDCLEFLIKDETILSTVLDNYYTIKNVIYTKKYIEESLVLGQYLDLYLDSINNITDINYDYTSLDYMNLNRLFDSNIERSNDTGNITF